MKKIALASAILLHLHCYKAQDTIQTRNLQADLEMIRSDMPFRKKSHSLKEWVKKSGGTCHTFLSCGCYMGRKENIREVRNRYLPNFKVKYDDYLQYAPAAAVYGLKLSGVKGGTI
jgi:hypothetical protein